MNELELNKYKNLASIQSTFPNDDLKLFDTTTSKTANGDIVGSSNNTVPIKATGTPTSNKKLINFLTSNNNQQSHPLSYSAPYTQTTKQSKLNKSTSIYDNSNKYLNKLIATPFIASITNNKRFNSSSNFFKVYLFYIFISHNRFYLFIFFFFILFRVHRQ
jgi:hypothetical protein